MKYTVFPVSIEKGLDRYINDGIMPGSFLYYILTNDLIKASLFVDSDNKNDLVDIVLHLYHTIPDLCWGSQEKVDKWLKQGGLNRKITLNGIDCISEQLNN